MNTLPNTSATFINTGINAIKTLPTVSITFCIIGPATSSAFTNTLPIMSANFIRTGAIAFIAGEAIKREAPNARKNKPTATATGPIGVIVANDLPNASKPFPSPVNIPSNAEPIPLPTDFKALPNPFPKSAIFLPIDDALSPILSALPNVSFCLSNNAPAPSSPSLPGVFILLSIPPAFPNIPLAFSPTLPNAPPNFPVIPPASLPIPSVNGPLTTPNNPIAPVPASLKPAAIPPGPATFNAIAPKPATDGFMNDNRPAPPEAIPANLSTIFVTNLIISGKF